MVSLKNLKRKTAGLQFTSTDYLSIVLTPVRICWTIPSNNEFCLEGNISSWVMFCLSDICPRGYFVSGDVIVPDKRSRILEVVVVRRLITWVWEFVVGREWGGLRERRSVYE
jgi:hypothetical protein